MKRVACPACGDPVDRLKQGALMNVTGGRPPFHLTDCPGAPVTDVFTSAAPQGDMDRIKRNQWGQPLIVPPGGGKAVGYQRVTTFIKVVESSFGLEQWKLRQVAVGLLARPDLCKAVEAHGPGYLAGDEDDKKTLDGVCKQALEAAASSGKATVGTALHRITERYDRGALTFADCPDWAQPDLDAYRRATDGIEWLHIERMTVNDRLRVAGTPDRIGRGPDGTVRVYDLKTGSMWASSCAAQMGVYANSQLYDIATGDRTDHGADVDRAVVIHLPAGSGEARLRLVDIAAGWQVASTIAPAVEAWQKRRDLDLGEVVVTPRLDVVAAVAQAATVDDLLELHARAVAAGVWTDDVRALFTARKAEVAGVAALLTPAPSGSDGTTTPRKSSA